MAQQPQQQQESTISPQEVIVDMPTTTATTYASARQHSTISKRAATPPLPVELIRPAVDRHSEEMITSKWYTVCGSFANAQRERSFIVKEF